MITIHGRATSSNVQPVVWLLSELDLPFERLDVGGSFGKTDSPAYRAMNPMGLIPVMQDGDLTLFESQAILRYLAAEYGTETLWPRSPASRAPVDQWMEWAKTSVAPNVVYKIFWQLVRTTSAERNHAVLAEGIAATQTTMAIAEARLQRNDWLAGPEMTLADITFGTQLFRYYELEFERADLPALAAYYDRLCARPAYREHVLVSFEPLRVPGA